MPEKPKFTKEELLILIEVKLNNQDTSIACSLYEQNEKTYAVSRKDGTSQKYSALLFKVDNNLESWLAENGMGEISGFMRAQGRPETAAGTENKLPVRYPTTKWFDWLGEEPRLPTRKQKVNALVSLLEFLITWSQEGNVGFDDLTNYEAKVRLLLDRLRHLGRQIEQQAKDDKARREAAKERTDLTTRFESAQKILAEVPGKLKAMYDQLETEETQILPATMKKTGYLLQILALAGSKFTIYHFYIHLFTFTNLIYPY